MTNMHITADIFCKPWAVLPERLQMAVGLAQRSSRRPSEDDIRARSNAFGISTGPRSPRSYGSAIAVIPIRGIISRRTNLLSEIFGWTSIDKLTAQFRGVLRDPSVRAIVFDVDSPGGSVEGVPELAEEIYKSHGQKKSVAVANGMAASAAYWIASAAGECVVIPSGQVGSIGVFIAHEDLSKALEQEGLKVTLVSAGKYKTDGNGIEPLSDSAREDMQAKVNAFYGMFVNSVARGRRASSENVRGGFGQGRMVLAADAVRLGMADRATTLDQVMIRIASGRPDGNRSIGAGVPLSLRRRQLELACLGSNDGRTMGIEYFREALRTLQARH